MKSKLFTIASVATAVLGMAAFASASSISTYSNISNFTVASILEWSNVTSVENPFNANVYEDTGGTVSATQVNTATVSMNASDNPNFMIKQEGKNPNVLGAWVGDFANGQQLLATGATGVDTPNGLVLTFQNDVGGVGTQLQPYGLFTFTASITAYSGAKATGNSIGTVSLASSSLSTTNNDGSAPFLGLQDTTDEIKSVLISLDLENSTGTAFNLTNDFALNNVLINEGVPSPTTTPEPASLALLGTGLLGLAFIGRKRWTARRATQTAT
ncbi:MAG: PEP-CTERM sorting domain-containing protein, partial [Terriglobales bacterium]